MAPTMLPFLYQTKTLQRLMRTPFRRHFTPSANAANRKPIRRRDAIPFEGHLEEIGGDRDATPPSSTMTPGEAAIFKRIFEDISDGQMPKPQPSRARLQTPVSTTPSSAPSSGLFTSGSIVDQARQARLSTFRDHVLQRYPDSLREAAQKALNLYTFEPSEDYNEQDNLEQAKEDEHTREARRLLDARRQEEGERFNGLMESCASDDALWELLEREIFTLPAKLGVVEAKKPTKSRKEETKKAEVQTEPQEKYSMDVYGPLFPQCLLSALHLFDSAFEQPSPHAFTILPRLKAIGTPSYVLGVTTTFYASLARMHWDRYGDAQSALEMIEEMNSIGLQPDLMVHELLVRILDELHDCTAGSQGPFIAAMMESPPYDATIVEKVESMEQFVRRSLMELDDGYA